MAEAKEVVVNNSTLKLKERAFLATKRMLNDIVGLPEYGKYDFKMKMRFIGQNDVVKQWESELLTLGKVAARLGDREALNYIQGQGAAPSAAEELASLKVE